MIHIIITSYKEPKSTLKAVQTFLKQLPTPPKPKPKTSRPKSTTPQDSISLTTSPPPAKLTTLQEPFPHQDSKITVVDPFPEVETFLKKNIKSKQVEFFLDPGEGKAYALNLLMQEQSTGNKDDIFIFTDGDVYCSDNAVKEILKAFQNKEIGCATAHPIPIDSPNTKYGFWSHVLLAGIHNARKHLSKNKKFFECSGYLFAIRQGVIYDFPHKTSEDSIIPYLFWKKGFRTAYLPSVEVYVKNPDNWKDWLAQKVRNVKGHENLTRIAPDMPRTKSLYNEILWGGLFALKQPKNLRQFNWLLQLYGARLYLYYKAFKEMKKGKRYGDAWRGEAITKSTSME